MLWIKCTYRDEALVAKSCITIGPRIWLQVLEYIAPLFILSVRLLLNAGKKWFDRLFYCLQHLLSLAWGVFSCCKSSHPNKWNRRVCEKTSYFVFSSFSHISIFSHENLGEDSLLYQKKFMNFHKNIFIQMNIDFTERNWTPCLPTCLPTRLPTNT